MNKPAAIAAQLVDVRNVNTHKCVRLILDVPAEQAMLVMEAFGWPTQVNPVPVAIARLVENAKEVMPAEQPTTRKLDAAADPIQTQPDRPHKPRKPVAADKRLAQQAGICCADPVFQQFLLERGSIKTKSEEAAAAYVRRYCEVASRSEIIAGTTKAANWIVLHGCFLAWKLVDAA